MQARDRRANVALFAAALAAWALVWWIVNRVDPRTDAVGGLVGAGLMGLAAGLTTAPLLWLASFGRHRRIAYRGDWSRALRRGGWVALLVAVSVQLRLEGLFDIPIGLFLVALVVIAEATLSTQR